MGQRESVEAWLALITRTVLLIVGVTLLLIESLGEGQRFYLIVAGLALCGPVAAQSAAAIFASMRGSAPNNGSGL